MKTSWRGWTLVDEKGSIITVGIYGPEPFTFSRKKDASDRVANGERVVRCVLKVEEKIKGCEMTLHITIPCADGADYVFPCRPVDIAPHLPGIEFVVHKSVTSHDGWVVAERTTGMAIPVGWNDLGYKEAIEAAKLKLKDVTPEAMVQIMEKAKRTLEERNVK